jgi:hypothetical protein
MRRRPKLALAAALAVLVALGGVIALRPTRRQLYSRFVAWRMGTDNPGGTLVELVHDFLVAKVMGDPPTQRFWVYINDQPANPWNSAKKGMTWTLLDVKGKAALVGADARTDAYRGDASIDEVLPILCVRKRNLLAPEGLDGKDYYSRWSGGEIRLTRAVAGKDLTSLEVANSIVKAQFGEGWEIGEHHGPGGGGWHWWGFWAEAPQDK